MDKNKKKTLTISSNLKKKIDTSSISSLGKKSFSVEKKKSFKPNKSNNKSNLSINREAIDDYLKRRHLISPVEHPIKNILNLKPGHKLFFKSI